MTNSATEGPPSTDASAGSESELQAMLDMAAPQPMYKKMIEQGGYRSPMPGFGMSYSRDLTQYVLRNHELFSSRVEMQLGNVRPLIPLNVDPPQHSKYRKLLDPLFAPRRMELQEQDITDRVNAFIDAFIDRGECNFTDEFADIFPASVFLGLMGLPESELRMFLDLRDGILHPERFDPDAAFDLDKRQALVAKAGDEVYQYFGALIERRQKEPAQDIITSFLAAEIDGERLSKEDILDITFLLVIAGLDTVSDSLTCFYAFLATHPEYQRQIVENPSIIPTAVEELLRWETPVPSGVPRMAQEDVELPNGPKVASGTAVVVSYGAANVDPIAFDDPFEIRFDRAQNPHIAFGGGVHRCLGSHLARRELRVTLREWHRRIPQYRIKPGHEKLEYPPGLRHVRDLILVW